MSVAVLRDPAWPRAKLQAACDRICDPAQIRELLRAGSEADAGAVQAILEQAQAGAGLQPEQAAVLLRTRDPKSREAIRQAARELHGRHFMRREAISAPVCPSNHCVNDCVYCPLRVSNAKLRRNANTARALQSEIVALLDEGYRHVQLVFGDDGRSLVYTHDMIEAAFGVRSGLRRLQRIDLNLNALGTTDLRDLAQSSLLGTYDVFQETYDPEVYAALHLAGAKSDYTWRITAHDRALNAGVRDVGLGVLLGAGDLEFDVVALLGHARYLEATYGRLPHSITYPRMIAAAQAPISAEAAHQVADEDFLRAVEVTRLALPETNIVLNTPAAAAVRVELYALGISHVSAGSQTYPGVYSGGGAPEAAGALKIGRPRGLEELIYLMVQARYIPDLCVECSEREVPGAHRASGAESFNPLHRRAANSLVALKEYLLDYASPQTYMTLARLVASEVRHLPPEVEQLTRELMEEAEAGLRGQVL